MESLQFGPSIASGDVPIDRRGPVVLILFPHQHVLAHGGEIRHPQVQALPLRALSSISAISSRSPCLRV